MMPRVAEYIRVSSRQQVKNETPEMHRMVLREYQEKNPGKIVGRFEDLALSGDLDESDRPGLRQLLDLVRQGGVDEVRVYDVDRFTRADQVSRQWAIFDVFADCGVIIVEVSTGKSLDLSDEGQQFVTFADGWRARAERRRFRGKSIHGRMTSLERGDPASAGIPWGIHWSAQEGWHLHEDAAAVVDRIYSMAPTPADDHPEGLSQARIGSILDAEGVLPPKGKKWDRRTIGRILRNPAYKGQLKQKVPGSNRTVILKVPAIVTEAKWQAAQVALDGRKCKPRRDRYTIPALLRGIAHCGKCGGAMYPRVDGHGSTTARYMCPNCRGRRHDCSLVDAALWAELSRRLGSADELLRKTVASPDEGMDGLEQEVSDAEANIRRLDIKYERLVRQWLNESDDDDNEEQHRVARSIIEEQRSLWKRRLATAQESLARREAIRGQHAALAARLETLRLRIQTADFATRRAIVQALFPPDAGRVVLNPDFSIQIVGMLDITVTPKAGQGTPTPPRWAGGSRRSPDPRSALPRM